MPGLAPGLRKLKAITVQNVVFDGPGVECGAAIARAPADA